MHSFCLPRAAPQCQDLPAVFLPVYTFTWFHSVLPVVSPTCHCYDSIQDRGEIESHRAGQWGGAQKPRDPALQCFSLELFSLSVFRQKIEYASQNIFVRTGSGNRIHNLQYLFHFPLFQCAPQVIYRKAEEKLGDSKVMLLFWLTVCQPWYWTLECDH